MARILVVEDNEVNLDMISRRLQKRGHRVLLAVDGKQGVEMAQRDHPDLILMDMSLPTLDGWEATRLLKADEATRTIPIIALTAHAFAGDREKCLQAGADEYETKPVRFGRLLEKINALLDVPDD